MALLTSTVPALHAALSSARRHDVARVDDGLRRFGVTGIHGEPEVGTTSVVEIAIRASGQTAIRVDLDIATSEADVATMLASGLARIELGSDVLSLMAAEAIAPARVQAEFIAYAQRVGEDVAKLALTSTDAEDRQVRSVLSAIGRVYQSAAVPPCVWIDHLQAPLLKSRHPLDVDALLWNLRSLNHEAEIPILLSGSTAATDVAFSPDGAFYGDGLWIRLERPDESVWQEVARALLGGPSDGWIHDMSTFTNRHPATMLLALAMTDVLGELPALELWQLMLSLDDGLAARAMQHARSLHRLGGVMLERVAQGTRPYEGAATQAQRHDRTRSLKKLHEAGLITQPRKRTWEVTNPLLAGRLRRNLPLDRADASPLSVPGLV